MTLVEILEQLPYDYQVEIKAKTGTAVYADSAGLLLEDHPKTLNLDDFELVSEIHLPGRAGGTLAELMGEDLEPIRFVVQQLIPEGLTILAGKPKLGKSWLALSVSLAICAGHDALEHQTVPGETLYVSLEDGKRRMQDRVRILDGHLLGEALERFHYRTDWPALSNGGLDQFETWMIDHPDTRLIVVDTYGKVRGDLPGRDRYSEEYNQLGALQNFATKHRLAVVLVHHLRKQGADDWLEQLSGTQAITGTADTLLGLFRERGQMDATLRLVSREVDEKDLALKFDGGRWESMGDAALYRQSVERLEVLNGLRDLGGEAKAAEVAALVDKRANTITRLLINLEKEGLVRKARYGVYELTPDALLVIAADPLAAPNVGNSGHTSHIDPPHSGHTPPSTITTITTMRGGTLREDSLDLSSHSDQSGNSDHTSPVADSCPDCGLTDGHHSAICPESPEW